MTYKKWKWLNATPTMLETEWAIIRDNHLKTWNCIFYQRPILLKSSIIHWIRFQPFLSWVLFVSAYSFTICKQLYVNFDEKFRIILSIDDASNNISLHLKTNNDIKNRPWIDNIINDQLFNIDETSELININI